MNRKKLDKIRKWVEELRQKRGIGSSELESLAGALGRVRSKKRGKEPTWVNKTFPDTSPLKHTSPWI